MINIDDIRFLVSQAEEKKKMLRMYPYFRLEIHLLQGNNLLAMDRGGKIYLLLRSP